MLAFRPPPGAALAIAVLVGVAILRPGAAPPQQFTATDGDIYAVTLSGPGRGPGPHRSVT